MLSIQPLRFIQANRNLPQWLTGREKMTDMTKYCNFTSIVAVQLMVLISAHQHGQHLRVKQMQCINKIGTSSAFLTFCTTLYCHRRGKVIKWVQKVACDKAQWFILVTQNHACIFSFLLLKSSICFCFC